MNTIDLVSWIVLAAIVQMFVGRFLMWLDCEVAPSKFDGKGGV